MSFDWLTTQKYHQSHLTLGDRRLNNFLSSEDEKMGAVVRSAQTPMDTWVELKKMQVFPNDFSRDCLFS